MAYLDKTLNCVDCSATFTFSAGEQEPTSLSVVLTADKPRNNSAVAQTLVSIATAIGGKEKCMPGVCAYCGADTKVFPSP